MELSLVRAGREVVQYRSLLWTLVARDLKVRYKRSVLGIVWTMLNPLLMMIVFSIVFASVFRFSIEHFTIYFLSAYVLWNFVSQTTTWSTACLLSYAPLIRKVYVPKAIFIIATVLSGLVNLIVALVPLALLMIVLRHPFREALLFVPVAILIATMFSLGVSFLLAGICVEFADVVHIYNALLLAWMYLTPIVYPLDVVPEHFRWIIVANPLYAIVETFREPIFNGTMPAVGIVMRSVAWSAGLLVFGWWVFERRVDRIAYLV